MIKLIFHSKSSKFSSPIRCFNILKLIKSHCKYKIYYLVKMCSITDTSFQAARSTLPLKKRQK